MKIALSVKSATVVRTLVLAMVLLLNAALLSRLIWGTGSVYSWQALKAKQSELSQELAELDKQRAALSREIRLLKTDPDYVEKVIRQRLNYVRKNEILYHFDKNRQEGNENENGAEKR